MASISNFLKNNILSTSKLINAKVSGALTSVNGTIGIVDSIFQKLFGNLLTGDSPLTDLTLSYEEQTIVNKDRAITSTAVDPVKVPITSSVASATLAETIIQNPSAVVSISSTQATDIVTEPTGIEPPMSSPGQYPHVHVYKSESGHIKEVDDTPGNERLLDFHKSGTYQEIAPDGRRVVKVVGDNYLIVVADDQIYIEGSHNLYVRGNMNITCLNDVALNVGGRVEMNVNEDFRLKAKSISLETTSGDVNIYSTNNLYTRSGANTSIFAGKNINQGAGANVSIAAGSNIIAAAATKVSIKSNAAVAMDAPLVTTNKGNSGNTASSNAVAIAKVSGLGTAPTREDTTAPSILESIIQGIDDDEEGQAAAIKEAIASGRITQEEVDELQKSTFATEETDTTSPNAVKPTATTANEIKLLPETSISRELKLSTNYRLSHLTSPGPVFDHQIRAQNGRTKAQLAGNLSLLARNVLEPIAKKFGPITINSAFRSGSGKSQHLKGMAVDITYGTRSTDPATMYAIAQWIKEHVAFDQLILEYGKSQIWTHVSFNGEGAQRPFTDRTKVMTCPRAPTGGYVPGLQKVAWKR